MKPFHRLPFRSLPDVPRLAHAYSETRAREIDLRSPAYGEIRIHYRELGSGPPLLLVHGLMTTSYSWRYVVRELAERHRVIALDLPGCGRSGKPAGAAYDAASLATFLGEFASALGIRGCAAVGNSLGGYLCMRAALEDSSVFSRLVNIHSPAFPEARYLALNRALAIPGVQRLLARFIQGNPHGWAHKNVHYFDETLKSLEEAREYGDPLATDEGVRAFVKYLAQTMAPSGFEGFIAHLEALRREGKGFGMPLLLVYSRQDPLVRPENGTRLAELVAGSELVWLDETSHFAHVDTPAKVLGAIDGFLRA